MVIKIITILILFAELVNLIFYLANRCAMGDFWDAWWQQTYQVKSGVLGNVRMLRTTSTMEIYLVSLLPPSVPKSPIVVYVDIELKQRLRVSIYRGYDINILKSIARLISEPNQRDNFSINPSPFLGFVHFGVSFYMIKSLQHNCINLDVK